MKIYKRHAWDTDLPTARTLQQELRSKLELRPLPQMPQIVAGADISYSPKNTLSFAAVLLFDFKNMQIIETARHIDKTGFPYISGYLTFREGPLLLTVFEKLENIPDVIIFDGQGIAHQRRMGIAAHLGLFLQVPTIGCAKKRLVGTFDEPGLEMGEWSPLIHQNEIIGAAVRTRKNTKPVFVSPGHLCNVPDAIQIVLQCCHRYRIPEPTRQAHLLVNQMRKEYQT